MQDILLALQDPQNAKSRLLTSVTKFRDEMEKCADLASEIDKEFQQLVATASEVNEAMSHKLSETQYFRHIGIPSLKLNRHCADRAREDCARRPRCQERKGKD